MAEKKSSSLVLQLTVLAASRLVLNTGLRMVYPFLPEFSRGLGVPLATVARLVSVRGFASLLSPFFGPLSERYGRRPILVVALLIASLGCAVVLIWPAFWPFGVALAAIAIAKVIYDPAMQAYLGDTVPYKQRGRAIAVTELSWAGAFFLGVPFLGLVIQRQGWQASFFWLGLFGLMAAFVLWRSLPVDDNRAGMVTSLGTTWSIIRRQPVIWAAAAYIMLVMTANELLLVVYGDWMEISFGLALTTLGLATGVIGAAEVTGEVAVGLAVDRFGKRPIIIATGFLTAFTYLVLPITSVSLTAALISLFFLFLMFEMTVVGGVPLMTELVPDARGVVMSVVLAAGGLGRGLGALIGPALWQGEDLGLLGLVAAVTTFLAILILTLWIREGTVQTTSAR